MQLALALKRSAALADSSIAVFDRDARLAPKGAALQISSAGWQASRLKRLTWT